MEGTNGVTDTELSKQYFEKFLSENIMLQVPAQQTISRIIFVYYVM